MDCVFNTPVIYDGVTAPTTKQDIWNFKNASCTDKVVTTTQDYVEKISTTTGSGNEFYIDKRISYGDIFIIAFLIIFLVVTVWKSVVDFIIPVTIKALSKLDV